MFNSNSVKTKMTATVERFKEEMKKVIEAISSLRPIDISLQILWSNFVAGLILSLTTALYASRS